MKFYGVAIERWETRKMSVVFSWLRTNYGEESKLAGLWFRDVDYDLTTLVMREDVYTMFMLKWGQD